MEISGNIEWQTPTAPELVLELLVAEGESVAEGQTVVVLE